MQGSYRAIFIPDVDETFVELKGYPVLPEELKLCKDRLDAMAVAKAKIAERAVQRYAKEKAEFDAKMDKRAAKEEETKKKPRGKPPTAPVAGVRDTDQIKSHGRRFAHHADARWWL